jgi:hypothetical protein
MRNSKQETGDEKPVNEAVGSRFDLPFPVSGFPFPVSHCLFDGNE